MFKLTYTCIHIETTMKLVHTLMSIKVMYTTTNSQISTCVNKNIRVNQKINRPVRNNLGWP